MDSNWIIKFITISFLFMWGTYDSYSAFRKGKKYSHIENRDKNSMTIMYITIFLGYGVGIPISFTDYGTIESYYPYVSFVGFLIIIAGMSIRLIAIKTLNTHFTYAVKILDNHQLITSGIYKYIRHPSYSGQLLIILGSGIAFSNYVSIVIIFIPFFLAVLYRISIEETVLMNYFTDAYLEYRKKTKLLIPWVY